MTDAHREEDVAVRVDLSQRGLLAADRAFDRHRATGLGDDRPDRCLAALGTLVLRAMDRAVTDVADDLAALGLARGGGDARTLGGIVRGCWRRRLFLGRLRRGGVGVRRLL